MSIKNAIVDLNDGTEFSETVKNIRGQMPEELSYDQLITLASILFIPYFSGREEAADSFCINLAFNLRFATQEEIH